jgi:glycosyltransferase involved in cell wall biosynthesis
LRAGKEPSVTEAGLNVTHVQGSDAGGGAELAAYELHRRLRTRGHDSRMLVGRKTRPDSEVVEIPRRRGPRGAVRLARLLERSFGLQYLYNPGFRAIHGLIPEDTDIVHVHSMHGVEGYADIGVLPSLSRRWPCVVTLQDMWTLTGHCALPGACERWKTGCGRCPDLTIYPAVPKDGTRLNWLRKRWVFDRSRLSLVTPSAWIAARIAESPLLAHHPVHVIPNPVDTSIFHPTKDKAAARAALGLPAGRVVVLVVANMLALAWKGGRHALDALNSIAEPDLFVALVGHGSALLAEQLSHPSLPVPYQSSREALARWYAAADILLMPSLEEIFGMVAAEAMACGTPVVAYATGGLPEVLGTDEGGILVPRGNTEGLAAAIVELARDEARRHALGRRAAARAAARFSLDEVSRRHEDLYRGLVSAVS